MGHFSSSRQHLEQAILRYDPRQHGVHVALYAQDPKVVCLSRLARTLWHLGNADLAARRAEESLSLARILGHPSSRAYALCFSAQLYFDLGDLQSMRGCLDELRPLIADQGMALWESYGNILEGMARVEHGIVDAGIRLMCEGMTSYADSGSYLVLPEFHGYFARTYMKLKANGEALAALEDGLAVAQRTGIVFRNAELLRLKGELMLESGDDEEAETLFRLALDTARRQEARMLMIRAAVPLAQMHHRKGQVDEARHLLCDVLGGFTESFETRELRTARRLLDLWTVDAGTV
jgi:predicted ATPase